MKPLSFLDLLYIRTFLACLLIHFHRGDYSLVSIMSGFWSLKDKTWFIHTQWNVRIEYFFYCILHTVIRIIHYSDNRPQKERVWEKKRLLKAYRRCSFHVRHWNCWQALTTLRLAINLPILKINLFMKPIKWQKKIIKVFQRITFSWGWYLELEFQTTTAIRDGIYVLLQSLWIITHSSIKTWSSFQMNSVLNKALPQIIRHILTALYMKSFENVILANLHGKCFTLMVIYCVKVKIKIHWSPLVKTVFNGKENRP